MKEVVDFIQVSIRQKRSDQSEVRQTRVDNKMKRTKNKMEIKRLETMINGK